MRKTKISKIRVKRTRKKGGFVKIFQLKRTGRGRQFVCVAIGNESFAAQVKRLLG